MSNTKESIRTPMARARALGSAKHGTQHFWGERVTGVALIPLTFIFVGALVFLHGKDHATVLHWIGNPLIAIPFVLVIATAAHHMKLGMQVIIEDYIHSEIPKLALLMLNVFFAILIGGLCLFALLKIAFVG